MHMADMIVLEMDALVGLSFGVSAAAIIFPLLCITGIENNQLVYPTSAS